MFPLRTADADKHVGVPSQSLAINMRRDFKNMEVEKMNEEKKKVIVKLAASQTEFSQRLIVVELPASCSVDDIESVGSQFLDQLATESGSDSKWEFESYDYDLEIRPEIEVGPDTDLPPDVVLHLDDGDLVAVE